MIKEQHTITISPQIWKILQKLSQIQTKSVSELLEESVQELLKSRRYNAAYLKIMASVEPCEDKENDELTHLLDKLTDDDLEIVEKYPL